ncbi:MAG: ATP-dependent DNA helicase RecG, partial [Bacteroidales bacterium]|jgi:ATP-dependent DNA helicase RecG
LLQGDVGSGKTLVALLSMLIALDNGHQACLMAPTEILAQQHFMTFTRLLANLPVKVRLLTGSTRQGDRATLHEELREGELDILIGTHALIEDSVKFHNLGLVVIDEQHRFGVAQRARLWEKTGETLPHVLVMTATPIPRTLAMTLYGDLDLSVIDEMPPGRRPIITAHYYDSKRLQVYEFIHKQIQAGRQIYIVYPLIQESETLDYKDLYDGYESICRTFPPPEYAVSVLHGRMKPEEKVKAMDYFVRGITKIMVSTTVIEVGVDVPNATVMVIESAERFGLSQLHQLRGRVGRGGEQSYCLLMTGYKLSKEAKTRIETMVRTNDGFEIADVDMKLRGPGDLEGTQQSGVPFNLSIANLLTDNKILEFARRTAQDVLEKDPTLEQPENQILIEQLNRPGKEAKDWSRIS